jgi:branched-chain amino acid transport system ATP-binding protein
VLEFSQVSWRSGGLELLHGFNWQLPDAGAYLLLGPTASGKSLLARLAAGRLRPSAGQVRLDGRAVGGKLLAVGRTALYTADELPRFPEPAEDYVQAELASAGGGTAPDLKHNWQLLETYRPGLRRRHLDHLSRGELALVTLAMALGLSQRLVVLDGFLDLLDGPACELAGRLLEDDPLRGERYVLCCATRVARRLAVFHNSFQLEAGLPVTLHRFDGLSPVAGEVLDGQGEVVRVYFASSAVGHGEVTSGQHYTVLRRMDEGLDLRLDGGVDAALAELRTWGLEVSRVEFLTRS